jgi:omega-6 fatty acid desaturase (delta-12 desaturase)
MRSAFSRIFLTPLALFFVTRIPLPKLRLKAKLYTLAYDVLIIVILILASKYGFMLSLFVGFFIPLFACYILVSIVFYLQHQFENTCWLENEDWSLTEASLEGSSFLIFGRFMKTVTCNIGYHHIHHLNPLIPCYNLEKAHNKIKNDITFKEVKISQFFSHMKGKLWDKKHKKLVSFKSVYENH